MCFSHYLDGGGEGSQRGLGHNLLMQFSRLVSSRMLVPLPSSRCLAEGNRIWRQKHTRITNYPTYLLNYPLYPPPTPPPTSKVKGGGGQLRAIYDTGHTHTTTQPQTNMCKCCTCVYPCICREICFM